MQCVSQPDGRGCYRMSRTYYRRGYHIRCGEAHAEVNAIRSVKDESLLKHSTNLCQSGTLLPLRENTSLCGSDYRETDSTHCYRMPGPLF